jgi:hypothetical protein
VACKRSGDICVCIVMPCYLLFLYSNPLINSVSLQSITVATSPSALSTTTYSNLQPINDEPEPPAEPKKPDEENEEEKAESEEEEREEKESDDERQEADILNASTENAELNNSSTSLIPATASTSPSSSPILLLAKSKSGANIPKSKSGNNIPAGPKKKKNTCI